MKKISFILLFLFICTFSFSQKNKTGSALTKSEADSILIEHNKLRQEVGNRNLLWSNKLAEYAQNWADQLSRKGCELEHSDGGYGENIYWGYNPTVTDAVSTWAEEKSSYIGETISYSNFMKFGHYTQIIWHSTTEVGCGYANCKSGASIWVCSYNPAGNMVGQKPIKK